MKSISDLKIAVVISMFDEREIVIASIREIRSKFPTATITVVRSDDGKGDFPEQDINHTLPNLDGVVDQQALPAHAVCRNFSWGFSTLSAHLAQKQIEPDLFVAFTGDTLITDATSFYRRYQEMVDNNLCVMAPQPVGQAQNGVGKNGELVLKGIFQGEDSTDFVCCLWFTEGKFQRWSSAFEKIAITNPWTSERCLGDEFRRAVGERGKRGFRRLNKSNPGDCYSYTDGVRWHAMNNGKPGR